MRTSSLEYLTFDLIKSSELRESDYKDNEKRDRAFRVLSKQKSFLARAKTIEMKEEWFRAIESAAK